MTKSKQEQDKAESMLAKGEAEAQQEAPQGADDAAAFESLLGDSLRGWDTRMEPPVPHLIAIEQLVSHHKEIAGRKLWQDLWKLWALGLIVIGGMMLMFQWNVIAFAILQGVAVAAALLILAVPSRKNREAKRRWMA